MEDTSRRNTVILIVVLALAAFALGLTFADFWIAQGLTSVDSSTSTYRFGAPDIGVLDTLNLYVEGDNRYTRSLRTILIQELEAEGVDIVESEELLDDYDDPVLAVAVTERDIRYNPFLPSAELEVLFAYFWNGNTTYYDDIRAGEPVVIQFTEAGLIREGTLFLVDNTRGVISYQAYINHLASEAAEKIADQILEIE